MAANARKTGKKGEVTFEFMGVKVTVPANLHDDWEFLEQFADVKTGNNATVVWLVQMICGDAYEEVKEAVRAEKGYVSGETMAELLAAAVAATEEQDPNS